jgi:uncharacterized OB-fold protein
VALRIDTAVESDKFCSAALNSVQRNTGVFLSDQQKQSVPGTSQSVISLAADSLGNRDGRPVLVGGRCNECGTMAFPRIAVCSNCMSESFTDEAMSERGKLYSWTTVHVGPQHMHKPITLGYVDLDNGVRVFSHLSINDGPLAINQSVRLSVAQVGTESDGRPIETFVFVPTGEGK